VKQSSQLVDRSEFPGVQDFGDSELRPDGSGEVQVLVGRLCLNRVERPIPLNLSLEFINFLNGL
jgi:hypothetical protein